MRGVDGAPLAAGEADQADPAFVRDAFARGGVGGAADRVVHAVRASSARQVHDRLGDVVPLAVDHVVGAEPLAELDLFASRDRRDDVRAEGLADLDGGRSGSAGAAEHEERLACLELRAGLEPEIGRVHRDQEGRALGVGHAVRDGQAEVVEREGLLGVAAVPGEEAGDGHDAIPDVSVLHGIAPSDHAPDDLLPLSEGERRRHGVAAVAHEEVGEPHAGGEDLDEDRVLPRRRR